MAEETATAVVVPIRKAAPRPTKRAPNRRPVAWTKKREERFLAALADSSNVAASARAAGVSESSARRRKAKSEDFSARWAAALREGYSKLESVMLERALHGVAKPVFHGGKKIATVTEYNDRLALALLTLHRDAVTGRTSVAAVATLTIDERRERLQASLSDMNRRMGGEG